MNTSDAVDRDEAYETERRHHPVLTKRDMLLRNPSSMFSSDRLAHSHRPNDHSLVRVRTCTRILFFKCMYVLCSVKENGYKNAVFLRRFGLTNRDFCLFTLYRHRLSGFQTARRPNSGPISE
jgi:hypothetical protein